MTALKKLWLEIALLLSILAFGCPQPPPAPEVKPVAPCEDGYYRNGVAFIRRGLPLGGCKP